MSHTAKAKQQHLDARIDNLETYLNQENPDLSEAIKNFRQLDVIAHSLGFLARDESYATAVPWWPLIAVLGTFSAGKSRFINGYLGTDQRVTGHHPVDDKFTFICFNRNPEVGELALDLDPHIPFHRLNSKLTALGGGDLANYVALEFTDSPTLRGKIIIDAPGWDADDQRARILRIAEEIVSLADLVLIAIDGRRLAPRAMRDTLEFLSSSACQAIDPTKFVYILNQLDLSAKENNADEVTQMWQDLMAERDLVSGRSYCLFRNDNNSQLEVPEPGARFAAKQETDLAEIQSRMQQVENVHAIRIARHLEDNAKIIQDVLIPELKAAKRSWVKRVVKMDLLLLGLFGAMGAALWFVPEVWDAFWRFVNIPLNHFLDRTFTPERDALVARIMGDRDLLIKLASGDALVLIFLHLMVRDMATSGVLKTIKSIIKDPEHEQSLVTVFRKNSGFFRPVFWPGMAGWRRSYRTTLSAILASSSQMMQRLDPMYSAHQQEPEPPVAEQDQAEVQDTAYAQPDDGVAESEEAEPTIMLRKGSTDLEG